MYEVHVVINVAASPYRNVAAVMLDSPRAVCTAVSETPFYPLYWDEGDMPDENDDGPFAA